MSLAQSCLKLGTSGGTVGQLLPAVGSVENLELKVLADILQTPNPSAVHSFAKEIILSYDSYDQTHAVHLKMLVCSCGK